MDMLALDPQLGSVLVRLMMVMNDLVFANETVAMWRDVDEKKRKERRNEAVKYFVELEVAHIFEGMRIIDEINGSVRLKSLVQSCNKRTREEFDALIAYRNSDEFQSRMGLVRHKLAFHYDDKLVQRALTNIAQRHPNIMQPVTLGQESIDWFFGPGTVVNERITIRDVFKIPEGADIQVEANKVLDRLFEIASLFGQFAGHFVWHLT